MSPWKYYVRVILCVWIFCIMHVSRHAQSHVSRHAQSHVCTHTRERMFGFLRFSFKVQCTTRSCLYVHRQALRRPTICVYLHTRMHACVSSLVAHADFAQCDSWVHSNRNTVWTHHLMSREFEISLLHPIDCLPAKCCSRSLPWRCTLAPERDISLHHSVGQYPKVHLFIRLISRHISVFFLSKISLSNSFAVALDVLNSTPMSIMISYSNLLTQIIVRSTGFDRCYAPAAD